MNQLRYDDMDIRIPTNMARSLNFELNILDNLQPLRRNFVSVLEKNVSRARSIPKTLTIQHHYDFLSDKISINGNASEIVRSFYGYNHPDNIDGAYLAKINGYPNIEYIISSLDKWLEQAREFALIQNIDLIDLFYWEQRMGNWGSMFQAEQDIAIDEFCPFNNRQLLLLMMNADKKYRTGPNYILYQRIINSLWPETLSEPINPLNFKSKLKRLVAKVISPSMKANLKALIKS